MFNINVFQLVNGKWSAIASVSAFTVGMLTQSAAAYVKLAMVSGIPVRIESSK